MPSMTDQKRLEILAGFEPAVRNWPPDGELAEAAVLSIAISLARQGAGQPSRIVAIPDQLWARARAVVDARFAGGDNWEELKDAIAALAEITGGGELKPPSS